MYDELISSLRICRRINSANDNCIAFHDGSCEAEPVCMYELMGKAADAIEDLQKQIAKSEADNIDLTGWLVEEHAKHQWIPVTERLPEEHGKYLVACTITRDRETICWTQIDYWVNGRFLGDDNYHEIVTHWMNLPEPPKGDE